MARGRDISKWKEKIAAYMLENVETDLPYEPILADSDSSGRGFNNLNTAYLLTSQSQLQWWGDGADVAESSFVSVNNS